MILFDYFACFVDPVAEHEVIKLVLSLAQIFTILFDYFACFVDPVAEHELVQLSMRDQGTVNPEPVQGKGKGKGKGKSSKGKGKQCK